MFILSDLEGNLVQCGNYEVDIDELKAKFASAFNAEIISTEDEVICNKALMCKKFKLKIENNVIIDVLPEEEPLLKEPTIKERLTQLEVLTVNNMSNQIENQILKGES